MISVLDDTLYAELKSDTRRADLCLFLQPHDQFANQWAVNAFDERFRQRLDGVLSAFDSVSWIGFPKFSEAASELGYEIVFMESPDPMYAWLNRLQGSPGVRVISGLEGTLDRNGVPLDMIDGFLPFQAAGVNFQKSCERMAWFQWSTGTGKTLGAEGTLLWRKEQGYGLRGEQGFDVCFIFAKPNNLVGTRRKLAAQTGLEGMILTGTPVRRERRFVEIAQAMQNGEQPIVILTYEKLRDDKEYLKLLIENHNVLNIWDEAPTKLRTRGTQIYQACAEIYYRSFVQNKSTKMKKLYYPSIGTPRNKPQHLRAKQMFTLVTSATPIYNSPQDTFSVVRLADPTVLGSTTQFKMNFVGRTNPWGHPISWKNLDLMGEQLAHVTYQVDKSDPEIAAMFPADLPEELVDVELHPEDQKLYDKLVAEYEKMNDDDLSILTRAEILAAIGCLQMLINNPRGVLASAIDRESYEAKLAEFDLWLNQRVTALKSKGVTLFLATTIHARFVKRYKAGSKVALKFRKLVGDDSKFTDRNKDGSVRCSKLEMLIDDVLKNESKVVAFSKYNEQNLPFIAQAFEDYEISYVLFRGGMTQKQRQEAIDAFKSDDSIQVFLSSDAGGDSIDLEEANLTVNYDTPWTDAALSQRRGREHRIVSKHPFVRTRRYSTPNSVEDRVNDIVAGKAKFHDQVYRGTIAEQAGDLRSWSKKGLLYALTGREINASD